MTAGQRPLQIPFVFFLLLVVAYLLPGLIGHDPWKQDETYVFSIVHHLLQGGDWVVPQLAGEPFMEKPPLYYSGLRRCWRAPVRRGCRCMTAHGSPPGCSWPRPSFSSAWRPDAGGVRAYIMAALPCWC